jgi:hypothetical protein
MSTSKQANVEKLKIMIEDTARSMKNFSSRNKNTIFQNRTSYTGINSINISSVPNKVALNTTIRSGGLKVKHVKAKSQVFENHLTSSTLTNADIKSGRTTIRSHFPSPQKSEMKNKKVKFNEYFCHPDCENIPLIKKLDFHLNELYLENEKLKRINNFFMISMNRKDDYLLSLLNHNSNLCKELNMHGKRETEHVHIPAGSGGVVAAVGGGLINPGQSSKNVIPKDSSKNVIPVDSPIYIPANANAQVQNGSSSRTAASKFKPIDKFNLGESTFSAEGKYNSDANFNHMSFGISASGGNTGNFNNQVIINPEITNHSYNTNPNTFSSAHRKSKFVEKLTFKKLEANLREEKQLEESLQSQITVTKNSNKKLPLSKYLTNMVQQSLITNNNIHLNNNLENYVTGGATNNGGGKHKSERKKNINSNSRRKSEDSLMELVPIQLPVPTNNGVISGLLSGAINNNLSLPNQISNSNSTNLQNLNLNFSPTPNTHKNIPPSSSSNIPKRRGKSSLHYENLTEMFNKKSRKESIRDTRASFLTISNQVLSKIITQDVIREILRLTNNDDEFLNAMRSYPDDKLIVFSDSIGTLIKDYDYSINLIKRIKAFLQVSIRVVNTLIIEDAVNMIIKNSCEILQCERTSIFVHDKLTNMLVIHAGEGLKKDEWKMPVNKGIVGHVFITGERQKIDDAYLDERFNRDVDKKTGFRTRSMLCVPLKDDDGQCFGVLQGMNKKNGLLFSADDEELIDIFASQASLILKNSMRFDDNLSFISRLKMLINFSVQVHSCNTLNEYTYMASNLLSTFWISSISQILIHSAHEECFRVFKDDNTYLKKPLNIGMVGRVFCKKEVIAANNAFNNPYFNNIVDLESGFSMITFPILDFKDENKVIAVGQVGYPFTISINTGRPKENDGNVVNFFSSISSFWLTEHLSKIDFGLIP